MSQQFPSQCESMLLAQRWAKAVDFGSPLSAWTPEMLRIHAQQAQSAAAATPAGGNKANVS